MNRIMRIQSFVLSIVFFLSTISPAAHAGNIDLNQTVVDLNEVEKEIQKTHGQSYLILQEYGEKSKKEILENLQIIIHESQALWDEDLDVYISINADIEEKRKRLKTWVETWQYPIDEVTINELKDGIADALSVARSDGLDVEKLVDIYDEMKKAISRSSFIRLESRSHIRDRSKEPIVDFGENWENVYSLKGPIILAIHLGDTVVEFGQHLFQDGIVNLGERLENIIIGVEDDRPTTQVARGLLEMLAMGEEMRIIRERAKTELVIYRSNLYKKAAIAFIRSLIYADEMPPECDFEDLKEKKIEYKEQKVIIPDCPDSEMVKNLRDYLDALRNIQAADAFALEAKVQELIAEQEMAEFLASFLPLVGEAIDIYAAFAGEDLAGYCVHGLERALRLFFGLLPIVGPRVFSWAANTETGQWAIIETNIFLFEQTQSVARNLDKLGLKHLETFADFFNVEVKTLQKLGRLSDEAMDAAERAGKVSKETKYKQSIWRKVREQIDAEKHIGEMPERIAWLAREKSDKVMGRNLLARNYGADEAELIAKSHMVPGHIPELKKLAEQQDAVIIYRSVNPDATALLEQDVYTKWMNVKGKSADWGVQRGYIPKDQNFSKLGKPGKKVDDLKIKEFQKQVDDCLPPNPACFGTTHLHIDGNPVMVIQKADGSKVTAIKDVNTGRYIEDIDGQRIDITDSVNTKFEPEEFHVLADENGNALTADYDFMDMGFKGKSHPKRIKIDEVKGEVTVKDLSDTPIYDPDKGYISKRQEDLLEEANRAVNKGGYNIDKFRKEEFVNISHHGPETGYPGTPGALDIGVDPEITAFDPIHKRFLVIERCDYKCMTKWCKTTGKCGNVGPKGPIDFCKKVGDQGCIPPDPNRLFKDYLHHMRLNEYTVGPNSAWPWGHYNPTEGWSFLQYVANLKEPVQSTTARQMKHTYIPKGRASAVSGGLAPEVGVAPRYQLNASKEVLKEALVTCREREH